MYNENMSNKRSRTKKGTYRSIRSDTKVGTVEKRYGIDLGVRSDMKLGRFLREKGYPSLSRILSNRK
jgi:hypothetical protein